LGKAVPTGTLISSREGLTIRKLLVVATVVSIATVGCGAGDTDADPATTGSTETTTNLETPATTEEIRFRSGNFDLVGELSIPKGPGPHPAFVMVHSGGAQTRSSTPWSARTADRFRDAGYAVLAYDKPGSGDSTGEHTEGHRLTELANILTDAIDLLVDHRSIDPGRIGVWGLSEAGWVMPLAMTMSDHISSMIVISGGGEDSIDQFAFQVARQLMCDGASDETGELMERFGAQAMRAATYEDYREAIEIVLEIPGSEAYAGTEIASEEDWTPWPRDIDSFFDPMSVIEEATMPILAVFGSRDTQIDPIQGAEAYGAALQSAGNPLFRVEVIPGVNHVLQVAETGCIDEVGGVFSDRYLEVIDEWLLRLADR
jgi:pimeloyl-ACP methyl ester carboxylesterase